MEKLNRSSVVNWRESYTEAQYHGQLTMDDVESIHISIDNYDDYDREQARRDIEEVRVIFNAYKQQHPESTVKLIEF